MCEHRLIFWEQCYLDGPTPDDNIENIYEAFKSYVCFPQVDQAEWRKEAIADILTNYNEPYDPYTRSFYWCPGDEPTDDDVVK